jgi:formylglycine-generating enzyme required for sulfatase activity
LGEYAWYWANSDKKTHPVGEKKPNAWGLYDMHGNVWEWCQDWYDGGYYSKSPADDPTGPATGSSRVLRGGNWSGPARLCRSAFRSGLSPGRRLIGLGFRVSLVPADKASTTAEPTPAPKRITNSIGMKLTLIPSGKFMMGSKESAEETAAFFNKTYGEHSLKEKFKDEHPPHHVWITKPFYLGTYHVTRGQFRQFVKDTGYKTNAETGEELNGEKLGAYGWDKRTFVFSEKYSWRNVGFEQTDEHPVVDMSWNDAVAFCKWLSRKEGQTYRLPTEAEWEYACRAGTTTRYYSGDDPETLAKVGNVADATLDAKFPKSTVHIKSSDGYVFTSPVGSFQPNAFGLYDMHGNAWQWCSDWYDAWYYEKSPEVDPAGSSSGDSRVLRGGSWHDWPDSSRSTARRRLAAAFRGSTSGFRVARNQ